MAQQTNCPACGAPIEYTGDQDEVRCGFCGAELKVTELDGQPHFSVLSQPGPQKEVLSQPVEGQGGAQVNPPTDNAPDNASDNTPQMDAWGFPAAGAQVYGIPAERLPEPPSAQPQPIPAAPYFPTAASTNPPTSRSARNWVLIIVGVVLAACVMFACMGGLILSVFRTR